MDQSSDEHPEIKDVVVTPLEPKSIVSQIDDILDQSFIKNVLKPHKKTITTVSCLTIDIPKFTYESKFSSKVNYPMSHYMSIYRLSKITHL